MTPFHGRWPFALALLLAAAAPCPVQAEDDAATPAGLVFDLMGSRACETVPPDMPDDAIEAAYAQLGQDEATPLRGRMQGFMAGERIGVSVFGTRTDDAGLAVVSSVMGPHPAGGHATLCLAMIQLGEVPVVPAEYAVVGAAGLDAASPGDMLVVGWVVKLEPTGRKGDEGKDIYRLAKLGEASVSGGSFTLVSAGAERFEARMEIRGQVQAADGSDPVDFSLEATSWGERGLDRIPALTPTPAAADPGPGESSP